MAKKSFKGGLGSLLESTFSKAGLDKNSNTSNEEVNVDRLKDELKICKAELALWRQGELNVNVFAEALENEGLRYNTETNTIEKNE